MIKEDKDLLEYIYCMINSDSYEEFDYHLKNQGFNLVKIDSKFYPKENDFFLIDDMNVSKSLLIFRKGSVSHLDYNGHIHQVIDWGMFIKNYINDGIYVYRKHYIN